MTSIWTPKPIGARLPGWEAKAIAVVGRHMALPIAAGLSDCLSVPADLAETMCGVVILPAHLRRYRTMTGAYRLLAKMGFRDVEEALAAAFPRLPAAMARRFDAGVVERRDSAGRPVLATVIVSDRGHSLGRDDFGPVIVQTLGLRATFAIGAR